ncbi:MAG TPA: hypothetical protein VKT78_01500 [Fimbriimonadaceae bacterium]|nr:hypothetical protein [Fimbriimonadaceae bacterium]
MAPSLIGPRPKPLLRGSHVGAQVSPAGARESSGYVRNVEIGAAEYRLAAEEHLSAAFKCHIGGDYLTCHYLCGLAVECILRAYRWKIDRSWSGRHVLPRLYAESKFDSLVKVPQEAEMAANLYVITSRWANHHRFTSPGKLLQHLNSVDATVGVKGDKLKRNSFEMYDAAVFIVRAGINKWKN